MHRSKEETRKGKIVINGEARNRATNIAKQQRRTCGKRNSVMVFSRRTLRKKRNHLERREAPSHTIQGMKEQENYKSKKEEKSVRKA